MKVNIPAPWIRPGNLLEHLEWDIIDVTEEFFVETLLLEGSSQDLVQWLGSPRFISHGVRPFGRGPTTQSLGDNNDHHGVLNH